MGNCWGATLPEEDDTYSENLKTSNKNGGRARKVVEFGREEQKLDELLASLRTGLVFAPTEFFVLPGNLNTTAKVIFTIGNSELQRRQEANYLKEEPCNNQTPGEGHGQPDTITAEAEPFKLKVTLEGHSWAKGLVMTLNVQPVLGPFARRSIKFHWREDILEIVGCEQGEMEAHSLPLTFETEVEFCKCCLQLIYQSNSRYRPEQVDEDSDQSVFNSSDVGIPSLKHSTYKVAVANLDRISASPNIVPAKLHHIFFGVQDPVNISITLWPKVYSSGVTVSLTVKSGILFGELIYLIKEHLCSKPDQILKLYSNHRPVQMSEIVSSNFTHLDCFVIARDNVDGCENLDLEGLASYDTKAEMVVSLIGKEIQSIKANLDMPMKEFDILVRSTFKLKEDNFLIILAEDDFAPQYTADDDWKCTYPFSIPDNSFSAGLRRSFRRLSTRRRGNGERPHSSSSEGNASVFAPLMAEVIELLSSDQRRFPRNGGRCGLTIKELYESMPMYSMSIEQCGIHPYSMIQVFEITGPSIPITVRVLSDYSHIDRQHTTQAQHTRLANIMDINPDWSINTFFQYIDAVVSVSSSSRQKQLLLKDNSLSDKDDLLGLTLGALLDSWKPLWWAEKGHGRRQLTAKDIDPSEYLIVEKF